MGSDNMTEIQNETLPPVEAVPAKAEEINPAQIDDIVEAEFYVEVEGDSNTPNEMSERQKHAAWKEERRKRKEAQRAKQEKEEELERLKAELAEVKQTVGNVARGKRPDPYDFDNVDDFYDALDKWQSHGKPVEQKPVQTQGQSDDYQLTEEQEWHYEKSRKDLSSKLPDFDETESRVKNLLDESFGLQQGKAFEALIAISHTFDVDFGKAMYALDKFPDKIKDIHKNVNNQAAIGRVLRDLESKVKPRNSKPIETRPEPQLGGGGQIDNHVARVEQARKAYAADPSVKNWNALQAAKKHK